MLVAVLRLALLFTGCTGSFSPYLVESPYRGAIEVIKSGNADEALREIEATAPAYDNKKDWMIAHRADLLARRGSSGVGKLGETPSFVLPAPGSGPHAPSSVTTSHPYFWVPFILVGEGK